MSECVAVLTSNKLRIQEIQKVIEGSNCCCVVCDGIHNFVEMFTHNNIDFYVLDIEDSQGKELIEYHEFYNAFLKYVPSDMRIVIGENNGFVKYDNFANTFVEKVACRILKGKSYKIMSNERINSLLKQIERYLIEKKFSPKYVGFEYVIAIMCFYLTTDSTRVVLSKDVYPKLCEQYNKSNYCIERNIRFFLQSNKFLGELVLDGNFSTKRIIEMLYRDIRKDVFIQKILDDTDLKD